MLFWRAWFLGALLLASGAAGADTPPDCEPTPWRSAGHASLPTEEELTFALRWGVVTAGKATLSIDGIDPIGAPPDQANARPAYHIRSYARSTGVVNTFYKVQDHSDAWLDTASLTTVRYQKIVREGNYRIQEGADFDQACRHYVQRSYRFDKKRMEIREGKLPLYAMDVLGCLYYMRTLPLAVGQRYTMDVLSGDKIWPLVVEVKKRETVKVTAGKFDCFVLEPHLTHPGIFVTKGKKVEVWITADSRRMPVRMRSEVVIGHVAAELIHS